MDIERTFLLEFIEKCPKGICVSSYPEGKILFANSQFLRILNISLKDKDLYLKEILKDPYTSLESLFKYNQFYRHRIQRKIADKNIWIKIESYLIGEERKYVGILIEDITKEMEVQRELNTLASYLECTSRNAQIFTYKTTLNESIPYILEDLGKTADVDRVYIFENHLSSEGELLCSQRYEWVREGIKPQINNPQFQNFPYLKGGFKRWMEELSKGNPIYGEVADFPEGERKMLQEKNTLSVLIIPLFVEKKWFGFIGFDSCRYKRRWEHIEIALLQSTASVVEGLIERYLYEEKLKETAHTWNQVFDALPGPLFVIDTNRKIKNINLSAQKFLQISKEEAKGKLCYSLHGLSAPHTPCILESILNKKSHIVQKIDLKEKGVFEVIACPIINAQKEIEAIVEYFHDITEKVKIEKEFNKRMRELEVFYEASKGREEKIIELKKEVNQLLKELNKPPKYNF